MTAEHLDELRIDFGAEPERARARAAEVLSAHGCFLAAGLIPAPALAEVRHALSRLIHLRARAVLGSAPPAADHPDRFDAGFADLIAHSRQEGFVIQDALRFLLPVQRLALLPAVVGLSEYLMGSKTVLSNGYNNNVRVAPPGETRAVLPWHQDYPYVRDSEDALTYWVPLRGCTEADGCLRLALGSHRLGVLPMVGADPAGPVPTNGRPDLAALPNFPQVSVPVRCGEALVFSALLLHASGVNVGTRTRWTVQLRHGNAEAPGAVEQCWPTGAVLSVPSYHFAPSANANG